jgi:hypothetical protein
MYKLGAIAERIYNELFTIENVLAIKKSKNVRGGCVDITEYFDNFPEGAYIQVILNVNNKSKDFSTHFDQDVLGAIITLNVWRKDFLSKTRKENKDYIVSILVHELCHCLDYIMTDGKAHCNYDAENVLGEDKVKIYALDKMEVNAYIHEIALYKKAMKKVHCYEDLLNNILFKISTFSSAYQGLSKEDFYDVMKVYFRRMARENLLPKCFTKN